MTWHILNFKVMFSKKPNPIRFAQTSLRDDEPIVVPDLAFDLADLDRLRQQGKPISLDNAASLYYDGQENQTVPYVPIERQRGTDINDVWNASLDGKKQLSKAGIRSVDFNQTKGGN